MDSTYAIPIEQCPHCYKEHVACTSDISKMVQNRTKGTEFLLLRCPVCGDCIVAKFQLGMLDAIAKGRIQSDQVPKFFYWPRPPSIAAPEHLPPNIRSFFLQGLKSLNRDDYDAAGTMFRKALDASLRHLHAEGKGTLYARINALPPEIGVTPAMREWAHAIRDDGNDAAHEEEPFTKLQATTLRAFTETFLTYLFTMPGMLAARKADLEVPE